MIPKSLHTVTAVAHVADLLLRLEPSYGPRQAVAAALCELGYLPDRPDPHGIADKAEAALLRMRGDT